MQLKRIIIVLLIIAAVGLLLKQNFIQEPVIDFLNQNIPWSIPAFSFVKDNLSSGSLMGLILYLLFVNIPFLPSPPAEAYIIFASLKGTNIFGIFFITILVSMVFAVIWYFIGRFYGQRILKKLLKRQVKYSPLADRFIGPLIFFTYMLPIPLPIPLATILLLLSGSYKTNLNKVIAAVGMGTLFRLILVVTLYQYLPFASWLKLG